MATLKSSVVPLLLMLQLHTWEASSVVEIHSLQAAADISLDTSTNHNSHDYLSIGKKPRFSVKRTLLKFEDIPDTCKFVERAELFVYYYEANLERWQNPIRIPFHPRTIEARQVLKDWEEEEATAFTRCGTDRWNKTYLEFSNTDARKDADDSCTIYPLHPKGYIKLDITPTARKWCNGEDNFGVILSAKDERRRGREIRVYSREKELETGEVVKPYLRITCWTDYCAPSSGKEGTSAAAPRGEQGGGEGGGGGGSEEAPIRMMSGNTEYMIPANSYQRYQE